MFEAWAAEAAGAASEDGGGYWHLAFILAGIGFLGLFARWRKARTPVPQTARQIRALDDNPDRHRNAADKALVELLETSRVLNAQVDSKIRVLNRLVRDAEECAASLGAMLAEARALREAGLPAPDAPAGPEGAAAPSMPAPAPETFVSDLHERIHRLRMEGRNAADIAKATNLSITEVEFFVKSMG